MSYVVDEIWLSKGGDAEEELGLVTTSEVSGLIICDDSAEWDQHLEKAFHAAAFTAIKDQFVDAHKV